MKVLIVGTGYVGLVQGACLAELGHEVICLDIDAEKIESLKKGIVPIYEPGLEALVKKNSALGTLRFTTSYEEGVSEATFCFLAVPTPSKPDGSADLRCIFEAASAIGAIMSSYKIIINKSTVPVGTAQAVKEQLLNQLEKRGSSIEFDLVSNPEFLKEGDAVKDFMFPDRIVLGGEERAVQFLQQLYAPLKLPQEKILCMDLASAEMTKYAANAMLASRISFMNEMASLCELFGADIDKIYQGISSDQRIGKAFLQAGCGYGGSCFPKDVRALKQIANQKNYPTPLLEAIDLVNENQKLLLNKKIEAYFSDKNGLNGKNIAIWGLAFKPGTDDMREASSLSLIRYLLTRGCFLQLYDPCAMKRAKEMLLPSPQITFGSSPLEVARGADALVLVTEWKEFLQVEMKTVRTFMRNAAFFDGRNQFVPETMHALGFDYFSIGRSSVNAYVAQHK